MSSSALTRSLYGAQVQDASAGGGGAAAPMHDVIMNGTGNFISDLSLLKSRGASAIVKFVGGPTNYVGVNSEFSLAMWKTWMTKAFNKTNPTQIANFVADGTLFANWLIDDLKQGTNVFSGGAPTFAELEEMAEFSKGTWTTLPCAVRVENQYLHDLCINAGASNYTYVDFGWAMWHNRFGAALPWFTNHVNDGRAVKLGALIGANVLNGGSGLTAPWNVHPNRANQWGMSPQEIDAAGAAGLSALTTTLGFVFWAQNPNFDDIGYWNWESIQTAMDGIKARAVGRSPGPVNWHGESGSTSGSTQTVAGRWNFLGYARKRGNHPDTMNVDLPASVPANSALCIVAYSRDSGRSSVCPSNWSEAQHISGTSEQGGDLALYYRIATGNEGGGIQALAWSGSVTDTACQAISFAFSGNTTFSQPVVLSKAGSARSWAAGSSNMGPVPGIQSTVSDAVIICISAKANDFANGDPVPDDTMSATTSDGETWNRMILSTNGSGPESGVLIDYTITSGTPSITTKSWTQGTGAGSASSGAGCGFMVAFAPQSIVSGQPPVLVDLEDLTMSVASNLSFTLVSTGSTPFVYSLTSGPSNVTLGSSTGAFQWSPLTTGDFYLILRSTNSFGFDEQDFTATIVSSGGTSEGGSGDANTAPSITHPGNKTVYAHDLLSFIVAASDAQGDDIDFALESNPAGSFIDERTGQFIWIPSGEQGPGTYPIVVVASDGQAESRSTFTVTVNDTPWTRDGGPSTQLGRTVPDNSFRRI